MEDRVARQPKNEHTLPVGKELAREGSTSLKDYQNGVFLVSTDYKPIGRGGVISHHLASSLSKIKSLGYDVDQVLPSGENIIGNNTDIIILCKKANK